MAVTKVYFDHKTAFDYRDMRSWCKDTFGKEYISHWSSSSPCDNLTPNQMMVFNGETCFFFERPENATVFALRWA